MIKNIYKLLLCAVLIQEISAVHNGSVLPSYRIQDSVLLKIRKQLITQSKRARTLLPLATVAGAGVLGYFFFDGRAKAKATEEIEKNRKAVVNNEILNEKQKNVLVPLVIRELALKQKEKEWEELPWYSRVWNGLSAQVSNNIGYVAGAVIIYKLQSKFGEFLKIAESYLPPLVEKAVNNLHPNPSFDWYKSNRTKLDQSIRDLSRYISLYTAPAEIQDIKSKLKELETILSVEMPDVESDNKEQEQALAQTKMQLGLLHEQKVQLEAKLVDLEAVNRHGLPELELCRRISSESSYVMQEIEKLLGFLVYADRKIVYSTIEAHERLQLRISNGHILRSLKAFANNLADTIDKEVMRGSTYKTLQFAKEVGDILNQIQEELNSFAKIEYRLE